MPLAKSQYCYRRCFWSIMVYRQSLPPSPGRSLLS